MKPKHILCLSLVLSGNLLSCTSTPIPTVESAQNNFSESVPNVWDGNTFSEILPAQEIKHILLLKDMIFRNPFLPKPSTREIQHYYNQVFNHLEHSGQKTIAPYLADNEMTDAEFAVITSSGNILRVQALSKMGPGGISSVLISSHGIEARINIEDFQQSSVTNQPNLATNQPQLAVETDYLLNQKPGNWNGQRFEQIIPQNKIKRIVLLEQAEDLLDYVTTASAINRQQERQMCYESLFDHFEASNQKAEMNSMNKDEADLAKLILIKDSGEVIYLKIVGSLGQIEHGKVVGNHIAGVLIHGPGKGVRINLDILPISSAK